MKVTLSEETRKILARSYSPKDAFFKWQFFSYSWLQENLSKPANRLLGLLIEHTEWGNIVYLTQTQMAIKLDISPQNAHKALRELVEQMVVYIGDTIVGRKCFILNPNFLWYGEERGRLPLAQRLDMVPYTECHLDEEVT